MRRQARSDVWLIDTISARVQCLPMAGVAAAEAIYRAFGTRVRAHRERLELTQLELSQRIGLTRGSVANIEAGRQSVLLHQFLAIADALSLKPEALLPVNEESPPTRETPDMPDTVKNAVESIKNATGRRAPSRR